MPTTLDTIQYRASPLSNWNVKNPNMMGIIHSIIRFVDACCAEAAGMDVIFCIRNMEPPTRIGRTGDAGFWMEYLARSSQRNVPSRGTAWFTWGSQG